MPSSRPHPVRCLALTSALLLTACQTAKPPMAEVDDLLNAEPPAAGASSCPPLPSDWLSNMPAQLRRIEPADCSQHAGTPLFAWGEARDRNSARGYSLVVRQAGGMTVHSQVDINEPRARLQQALAAGNYEWAISYSASNGTTQTTQWRRFSVAPPDGQVRPQDLAEGSQIAAQVAYRNHPRVLATGGSFERLRPLALQAEHLPTLSLLRSRAAAVLQAAAPASPPPVAGVNALVQAQNLKVLVADSHKERLYIEAASLIARLDGNVAMLAAAKRRLLGLAAWPAGGSTGEAAASAANAELTQALAFGLDLLWNDLNPAERAQVVAPLRERLLQGSTAAFTQLDREPHVAANLLRLRAHTQALLLAAGTFPESQTLLARAWELNRHSLQYWGSDGNQGPAIAQAWQQFAANTNFAAAVRTIAGVDLYGIATLRRSADQLIAFTPPGAEQPAAFGDEGEIRDLYDRNAAALRLHAQQSRDLPAIWYWQAKPANLSAPADATVWQLLLLSANPQPLPSGSAMLANDWYSTQAGLAAMHSDIRSPTRSSVYFLSGPYGAYGAGQAEQNALVYVSQGRPLLVNAGSTPYVGSPHHRSTRATRFKNALTFDGGIGQAESSASATRPGDPLFNMDPNGSLIRAVSLGSYAAATGDATAAYRAVDTARNVWTPLLSNAVRSVVMDKANGLTLVYDWATSAKPRQWELNFHAPNAFTSDAVTVRSSNGGASVCLDRYGPATQFTQTAGWEVAPELAQAAPAHGRFSTLGRSSEFAHLTVLREGCRIVPVQVSQTGSQINILINGRDALQFDRRSLTLPSIAVGSPPLVSIAAAALIGASATAGAGGATSTSASILTAERAGVTTASAVPNAPSCEINQTRYFAGSCWADVKDTIPSGENRNYSNNRLNHIGLVNANCVGGKISWSTGNCRPVKSAAQALSPLQTPKSSDYKIGTFYFPGWRDNQVGAPAKFPWDRIKAFPEREPLLGWYDDGNVSVVEQQLKWMRNYGIDYVVFDWYWNGKNTELSHSINAYLRTETKKDVPFAILWSNHSTVPRTMLEFTSMVDFWIAQYFNKPEYLKIDDKPVVYIFSHIDFANQASKMGQTFTGLLNEAERRARQAGHKGIYFVGGTHIDSSIVKKASGSGYSAFSSYNYHGRADDVSINYEELDSAYQYVWNWIVTESSLPYIVPMTQGWDKRPWGGSTVNPLHDLSGGSIPSFERHLIEARRLMDANPQKTMKMGVICCWNEFGEGSYIEPTKRDGFGYLEKVKNIFGAP